jgi:DivIVA domain-containing protein
LTLDDIHRQRFRASHAYGYDMVEVDTFMAEIESFFTQPGQRDRTALLDLVRHKRFNISKDMGYEPEGVDEFIDMLEKNLEATPAD